MCIFLRNAAGTTYDDMNCMYVGVNPTSYGADGADVCAPSNDGCVTVTNMGNQINKKELMYVELRLPKPDGNNEYLTDELAYDLSIPADSKIEVRCTSLS